MRRVLITFSFLLVSTSSCKHALPPESTLNEAADNSETFMKIKDCADIDAALDLKPLREYGANACACGRPFIRDKRDYLRCLSAYGIINLNFNLNATQAMDGSGYPSAPALTKKYRDIVAVLKERQKKRQEDEKEKAREIRRNQEKIEPLKQKFDDSGQGKT